MVIFIALLGLVVGSFLGLCFWRIPNNESVIYPRSYCPSCKSKIRYLPKRIGERHSSALVNTNLSNKIYKYYGKVNLKNYINDFIKDHSQ